MHSTLILIGGNELQLPTLRWAHEAGLEVVCTDSQESSPTLPFASRFEVLAPEDVQGHVELARSLASTGTVHWAYSPSDRGLASTAAVGRALDLDMPRPQAVERALDGERAREAWTKSDLPHDDVMAECCLEVNGFFRDGAFQPAGIFERGSFGGVGGGVAWGWQPCAAEAADTRRVYELLEMGARALGFDAGPVMGIITLGEHRLLAVRPRFHEDARTAYVSPIVYGKSPLQSWFAHLVDAGGPFDEMPLSPRGCGGWLAILPDHEGRFEGIEGMDRARRMSGIRGVISRRPFEVEDLKNEASVCGFLWAEGNSKSEVEYRLRSARSALSVKITWPSAA